MLVFRLSTTALFLAVGLATAEPPTPLAVTPEAGLKRLAAVDGRNPATIKEVAELFAEVRAAKFDHYSFADACLIIGGITDLVDRRHYKTKLDAIEAEARSVTASSKSAAEDGARLLKFLHAGAMAKGYKAEQSDLHVLLDTGVFNCVSSAVLYTVIGQRLGLDVRAVETPQHVFCILNTRDRRIDVETTNARGFDADPKRKVGPPKAEVPIDTRREVKPAGLASVVAYNHGVEFARQKRFAESVRAYLLSLGFDSDNHDAAANLIADLVNWPLDLAKSGKYAKAIEVIAFSRELTPKEEKLRHNTIALYDEWAKVSIDRKDWAGAIRVYEQALRELPGEKHFANNLAYCRQQVR
jgi:tetratricopeptide (TPR) repeat protein